MITNFNARTNVKSLKLNKSENNAIATTISLCSQIERDAPEHVAKLAREAGVGLTALKIALGKLESPALVAQCRSDK